MAGLFSFSCGGTGARTMTVVQLVTAVTLGSVVIATVLRDRWVLKFKPFPDIRQGSASVSCLPDDANLKVNWSKRKRRLLGEKSCFWAWRLKDSLLLRIIKTPTTKGQKIMTHSCKQISDSFLWLNTTRKINRRETPWGCEDPKVWGPKIVHTLGRLRTVVRSWWSFHDCTGLLGHSVVCSGNRLNVAGTGKRSCQSHLIKCTATWVRHSSHGHPCLFSQYNTVEFGLTCHRERTARSLFLSILFLLSFDF